jgi:transposase InsO family protein
VRRTCPTHLTRDIWSATTGKIERWHKTLRTEFLADHEAFTSLADAQAKLDTWVSHYNCDRPHQSLGMATPASRFAARRPQTASRTCSCGCRPA